jgi:hypothetical protein
MTTYFTVRIVTEQVRFEKSYNEDSTIELLTDHVLISTQDADAAMALELKIARLFEAFTKTYEARVR